MERTERSRLWRASLCETDSRLRNTCALMQLRFPGCFNTLVRGAEEARAEEKRGDFFPPQGTVNISPRALAHPRTIQLLV